MHEKRPRNGQYHLFTILVSPLLIFLSFPESIANLNLRYGQLKSFYDSSGTTINSLQNKLLVLGSEV